MKFITFEKDGKLGIATEISGAFSPCFVSADALPSGCVGLKLQTRLTLKPGDVIVTGTPSGVGLARKPPLWMKPGNSVEVEIAEIGRLRNPIVAEQTN